MSGIWGALEHRLIDTHCHLLDYQSPDFISKLAQTNITIHAVTTTLTEYKKLCPLVKKYPNILPSMGLFPLKVKDETHSLEEFLSTIKDTQLIGEVGLDYTSSNEDQQLQKNVLKQIIAECQRVKGRILSLHSRRSAEDVLRIIGDDFHGTAIMHWYSGPIELIKATPKNIFFSINAAMLKSRNGKQILNALQPSQILTETDGPYVKVHDRPSEPSDIKIVIQSLSQKWGVSIEAVLSIIDENYRRAMNR
jgi:TatD DNase family protein